MGSGRVLIFHVTTLYGVRERKALVQVEAPKLVTQMTPEEAETLALNLLSASQAAITDAFLVEFTRDRVGIENETIGPLLSEFRRWRTTRARPRSGADQTEESDG